MKMVFRPLSGSGSTYPNCDCEDISGYTGNIDNSNITCPGTFTGDYKNVEQNPSASCRGLYLNNLKKDSGKTYFHSNNGCDNNVLSCIVGPARRRTRSSKKSQFKRRHHRD